MTETDTMIAYDEAGNALTKEEAEQEEQRLLQAAEVYFKGNPDYTGIYKEKFNIEDDEEEEDEKHTVTVDNEGEVINEVYETTKEKDIIVEKEVIKTMPGFVEQVIIKQVIHKRLKAIADAFDEISKTESVWLEFSKGMNTFDNFVDMYRTERRVYRDLLNQDTVVIEDIENGKIRASIKREIEQLIENMLDFSDGYREKNNVLKELTENDE